MNLKEALRQARAMLAPPPDISVVQWADSYRVVAAKTSAAPGQWKTATQPVAYGAMLAATESDTHTVTIMAATQIAKSEILLNICGYFIMVDPAAVLFVQPTQGAAQSFAKERFSPMVAATPELAKLVALPRARDSEATISHRSYPGGSLDFVGGNSPVDLSSRPKRIVLADEIDKFPLSAGSEGDPLKLAEERASTYRNVGRSLCVRTCSPTDKETSRIWREYGFSDQRKCFVPCPHCGHEQVLTWASWDEDSPETARILCSGCGAYWGEADRKEAVRALEQDARYLTPDEVLQLWGPRCSSSQNEKIRGTGMFEGRSSDTVLRRLQKRQTKRMLDDLRKTSNVKSSKPTAEKVVPLRSKKRPRST